MRPVVRRAGRRVLSMDVSKRSEVHISHDASPPDSDCRCLRCQARAWTHARPTQNIPQRNRATPHIRCVRLYRVRAFTAPQERTCNADVSEAGQRAGGSDLDGLDLNPSPFLLIPPSSVPFPLPLQTPSIFPFPPQLRAWHRWPGLRRGVRRGCTSFDRF